MIYGHICQIWTYVKEFMHKSLRFFKEEWHLNTLDLYLCTAAVIIKDVMLILNIMSAHLAMFDFRV